MANAWDKYRESKRLIEELERRRDNPSTGEVTMRPQAYQDRHGNLVDGRQFITDPNATGSAWDLYADADVARQTPQPEQTPQPPQVASPRPVVDMAPVNNTQANGYRTVSIWDQFANKNDLSRGPVNTPTEQQYVQEAQQAATSLADYAKGRPAGLAGAVGDLTGIASGIHQISKGRPLTLADFNSTFGTDAVGTAMGADITNPLFGFGTFGGAGIGKIPMLAAAGLGAFAKVGKGGKVLRFPQKTDWRDEINKLANAAHNDGDDYAGAAIGEISLGDFDTQIIREKLVDELRNAVEYKEISEAAASKSLARYDAAHSKYKDMDTSDEVQNYIAPTKPQPLPMDEASQFVKYADKYPDLPAAVWNTDKKIKKTKEGDEFQKVWLGKGESPETRKFMADRRKAQKDIDAGNYEPYFDPDKRHDVVSQYPQRPATVQYAKPKKQETVEKWRTVVKTSDAKQRLMDAYRVGHDAGGHDAWYKMGQLEEEFIKELGPEAGAAMFRERFSDAMSATTGGSSPKDNLIAAAYANYQRVKGNPLPKNSYDINHPVGGRYISTNMSMYDKAINQGEGLVGRPKRQNFSSNFEGDADVVTVDEHMTQIITPGKNAPQGDSYFAYEELIKETAEEMGISARELQEVAWAGRKINLKGGYDAKSMIEVVNEAIERTARLTGRSPAEVVRKGLVRGEMPIYGLGGAALLGAARSEKEDMQ